MPFQASFNFPLPRTFVLMHQSIPAAPSTPPHWATAGHLPALSVPGMGHLQILCCPGHRHLPNPGTHAVFYQNITTQRILHLWADLRKQDTSRRFSGKWWLVENRRRHHTTSHPLQLCCIRKHLCQPVEWLFSWTLYWPELHCTSWCGCRERNWSTWNSWEACLEKS